MNKYKFSVFFMHIGLLLGVVPGLLFIGILSVKDPARIALVIWAMCAVLTVWLSAMKALKYKDQFEAHETLA